MQDGYLSISVINASNNRPIQDALVNVYGMNDQQESTGIVLENLRTDESGQVRNLTLDAPNIEYSLQPSDVKPYSEYIVEVIAQGFETVQIRGTQILPAVEALQNVPIGSPSTTNRKSRKRQTEVVYDIAAHTLWGNYPPKIPESSLKPLSAPTGFVVLDEPVVPEFIVVHDGLPEDTSAENYWVPFREYIKNVASSEIYSTWPDQTIYANVIAIISFTLNRVFTEWYRNKGYNFTITSSTAYDHKYIHNRNIFDNISVIVDEVFNTFIKRPPTARQPLLAQYCDGKKSQCPDQMTQWGSKDLGDQGMSYDEILRYFYGDNIVFSQANVVSGVPVSFPGFTLQLGSNNSYVRTIQNQLNAISNSYPAIEKVSEDGVFGPATEASVKKFQEVFNLPQTGVVDFKTWYAISRIYVATTKIASLNPVI
ncbi:MAG: spore cortex-lytic germination protein SleC [Clostridiales bacterium]|uniref:spore cortex-lytic germination protein SleC n=1 Tax=Terrisporobacter sp. TaxID=1965305 RepID=UPI002A52993E|nr:spore cortex-lytic germination protein SleC [Terrisporobacter sp.]MCI5628238.1 peptidoglycan-binding protein [Clostridium sp.]MDD7757474.1 spore cortex-lytic germination protein SleC [Clostridiales bacterium]MCI7205207.1 peptidoglycan-binding protein [Clostridium sp.]MDY4137098.1 spore cortex-lytic germination protein SleC [Terrisporobacter sp.]MDY4735407.1 spore cortex-lytic germination protein SleC [Terrisporobacter sp.]